MSEQVLNVTKIIQDAKKRFQYPQGFFVAGFWCLFFAVVALIMICRKGESFSLDKLLVPMLLFLSGMLFLVLQRKSTERWAENLQSGNFYLIQNPVNDINDTLDDDLHSDRRLRFNFHDVNGRYESPCSAKEVKTVNEGDQFYLVLQNDREGKFKVICYYPVETTVLDDHLLEILQRDTHLTGYELSFGDELKRRFSNKK